MNHDVNRKSIPTVEILILKDYGEVEFKQSFSNFIEPKLDQKSKYANYEVLKGEGLLSIHDTYVRGKARIHGMDCFEIVSSYCNFNDHQKYEVITFERCTDTHVQALAFIEESRDGTREFYTFKDQHFMEHWAIGENNCGLEIKQKSKGIIIAIGDQIISANEMPGTSDIIGEYLLTIDGEAFKTVRMFYIGAENQVTDFFIGMDGKEIMHRYFIPDHGFDDKRIDYPYSHEYPNAHVIRVNDRKCICTNYVFGIYE